ncbi:sulfatase [Chloroflexota bacterium]
MKNVILITLDAVRKDVFGAYGSKEKLTGFINSLQDKCLVFTKGQNSGPYTQASFPGILTSSYYLDYGKPKGLSSSRTLVSEPLKDAGIVTAAFHSNPYICGYLGWNRGWDVFYDSMDEEVDPKIPYVRGDVINNKVMTWLSQHVTSIKYDPFFLWLHYMDVHEPYIPERRYIDMVDPSISASNEEMHNLFENTVMNRDISDPAKVSLLKKLYNVHVREIDIYTEELFSFLEKQGLLGDCVIVITNDHGDEFGEHGGLSHDDKMYAELVDMPLFIYGSEENGFCHKLVSNIDISPTIIALFDLKPVQNFQGKSLIPLDGYQEKGCFGEAIDQRSVRGGDIEKDVYFYCEHDLKVIYRANLDNWEMYDLEQDPKELNNIITVSPHADSLKEKLKPRVRRWL